MHAYIHTCVHAYIQTDIYIYICVFKCTYYRRNYSFPLLGPEMPRIVQRVNGRMMSHGASIPQWLCPSHGIVPSILLEANRSASRIQKTTVRVSPSQPVSRSWGGTSKRRSFFKANSTNFIGSPMLLLRSLIRPSRTWARLPRFAGIVSSGRMTGIAWLGLALCKTFDIWETGGHEHCRPCTSALACVLGTSWMYESPAAICICIAVLSMAQHVLTP